jgi:UDP-N-acetylglucosamine diphosphorylase/glucosamine-1-phosphate N-acetyltransferase
LQLAVFEDEFHVNFQPLTLTRPAYMLICGTRTILENILDYLRPEGRIHLFTRPYLAETVAEKLSSFTVNMPDRIDDEVLLVNGLLLPDPQLMERISTLERDAGLVRDGRVLAARLSHQSIQNIIVSDTKSIIKKCAKTVKASNGRILKHPWELIDVSPGLISLGRVGSGVLGDVDQSVRIYGDQGGLYVAEDAVVEYGSVLDTRSGPIHIGAGTVVKPFSRIEGPVWIGENCVIESCILKGGTTLGDWCRVGGEVESSIFQGYTNKRHLGYVGHSYLGEWVNIGAGTNVSNLKNTYGTHRMIIGGERIDTGRMFLGCFLADHVKTGIGTLIMGAKRVGVSSHVYGDVMEDVPSYTAYSRSGRAEIQLDSAINTARRMMARRSVVMTPAYERMMRTLYELTRDERMGAGVSSGSFRL